MVPVYPMECSCGVGLLAMSQADFNFAYYLSCKAFMDFPAWLWYQSPSIGIYWWGWGIGQPLMGGPGSLITDHLTHVGFNLGSRLACSIDVVLSVITKVRLKKAERN